MAVETEKALHEWKNVLSPDSVKPTEQATLEYGINTLGSTKKILAALSPHNTEQIIEIVKIANHYNIPLYPISTGKNWGYGCSVPVKDNCVIVDLSRMNKIIEFDPAFGIVTLQPGVTQGQLWNYLQEHQFSYLVPTTGAGPHCSIIGNALERGYGLAPLVDHFGAMTAIEVVLPDGHLYQSPLYALKNSSLGKTYKWGVGPYIDGLFAQSNFGIVVGASFQLIKKPQSVEFFFFKIQSIDDLAEFIPSIQKIITFSGSLLSAIKISNQHLELTQKNSTTKLKLSPWIGAGVILGEKNLVKTTKKLVKKCLKKNGKKVSFIKSHTIIRINKIVIGLNKLFFLNNLLQSFHHFSFMLNQMMELFTGTPNETGLSLAYSRRTQAQALQGNNLNPTKDGCGIIWFSPLVPMDAKSVKNYIETVKKILIQYQFKFILTLTHLNTSCFDSAVPIIFDKTNSEELHRAHQCYVALFEACKKQGFYPYRMPAEFMQLLPEEQITFWQTAREIKKALDPNDIISPGRYSL